MILKSPRAITKRVRQISAKIPVEWEVQRKNNHSQNIFLHDIQIKSVAIIHFTIFRTIMLYHKLMRFKHAHTTNHHHSKRVNPTKKKASESRRRIHEKVCQKNSLLHPFHEFFPFCSFEIEILQEYLLFHIKRKIFFCMKMIFFMKKLFSKSVGHNYFHIKFIILFHGEKKILFGFNRTWQNWKEVCLNNNVTNPFPVFVLDVGCSFGWFGCRSGTHDRFDGRAISCRLGTISFFFSLPFLESFCYIKRSEIPTVMLMFVFVGLVFFVKKKKGWCLCFYPTILQRESKMEGAFGGSLESIGTKK